MRNTTEWAQKIVVPSTIFLLLSGCCVASKYEVHSFYSNNQSVVIDGNWMYSELKGKESSVNLFPVYTSWTVKPPYKAGISIIDYSNRFDQVTLTGLTLKQGARELQLLKSSVHGDFIKCDSHPNDCTRRAECFVDISSWPIFEGNEPIQIEASFTITGQAETNQYELGSSFSPFIMTGTSWFEPIHD